MQWSLIAVAAIFWLLLSPVVGGVKIQEWVFSPSSHAYLEPGHQLGSFSPHLLKFEQGWGLHAALYTDS
jgi:hypothetical protein